MAESEAPREVQIRLPDEQMKQYMKLHTEDERLGENLGKVSAQLDAELRTRRTKFLTRMELSKINTQSPAYKPIGKAFVLDNIPNTLKTLREDIALCDKKILMIKKAGIYVANQQDQLKMQINELVKPYIGK